MAQAQTGRTQGRGRGAGWLAAVPDVAGPVIGHLLPTLAKGQVLGERPATCRPSRRTSGPRQRGRGLADRRRLAEIGRDGGLVSDWMRNRRGVRIHR